jgi:hypothetical protein
VIWQPPTAPCQIRRIWFSTELPSVNPLVDNYYNSVSIFTADRGSESKLHFAISLVVTWLICHLLSVLCSTPNTFPIIEISL